MIQQFLKRLFSDRSERTQQPTAARVVVEVAQAPVRSVAKGLPVPIYPPSDSGIAVVAPEVIVASQEALIASLRRHVSLPPDEFDRRYLQPITRLASFVGLLPASKDKTHAGAGGLFRFALSLGVGCAKSADGVNWADGEPPEQKRQVEAAWRQAAFLAGLCCELHRPLVEMHVFTKDGSQWGPYISGLTDWALGLGVDRFFVKWQAPKGSEPIGARASTAFAVSLVAGDGLLQDMHAVSPRIVQALLGAVTGTISALDDHPLMRTINTVRARVVEVDDAVKPQLYGALTQGAHLEPYVVDAIRRKVQDGTWKINEKGARIHVGSDGVFLAWPIGGKELLAEMRARDVKGIPASEATLAEIMASAGIITIGPQGQPYHFVHPVNGEDSADLKITAVRFAREATVFGGIDAPVPKAPWALAAGKPKTPDIAAQQPQSEAAASAAPAEAAAVPESVIPADTAVEQRPPKPEPVAAKQKPTAVAEQPTALTKDATEPHAPSTPSRSANDKAKRAAGGVIAEVEEVKVDVTSLPPDIVASLGAPLAREVIVWRDKWNEGRSPGQMALIEGDIGGVAISLKLVQQSALESIRIQEPLKSNGFLSSEAVGGKQKWLRKVEFSNGPELAYVLKRAFAKRCGFTVDGLTS